MGFFFAALEGFHRMIDKTSLDPSEIQALTKFHFYGAYTILGIFIISLIIQLAFLKYEELFEEEK